MRSSAEVTSFRIGSMSRGKEILLSASNLTNFTAVRSKYDKGSASSRDEVSIDIELLCHMR